jgi:hypothetical protein
MVPTVKIAVLLGGLTLAFLAARAFLRSEPSSGLTLSAAARGFAVVELFTSEGCSSCPPADQLVAKIQQEDKDLPVYILAFHVDYWNRLGWKDGFSDNRYSQRQNQYATWLNLQSVYTPQIIVNGRKEFVGSQESTLRSTITADLGQDAPAQLTLTDLRHDKNKIAWRYQVQNAGQGSTLIIAVVQRPATTDVKAGENSGRTLSHVQIVRDFTSTGIGKGGGEGSLSLPKEVGAGDEELIAFVQNDSDGRIIAATSAAIP